MERVALYLQDSHDLRDGLDYVRYAEECGFEAVWQAESRLVRDAIVPMAAYAAVTTWRLIESYAELAPGGTLWRATLASNAINPQRLCARRSK